MLAIVVLALLAVVAADEKYTTKYDNVDIKSIFQNDRLLMNYFNCLMDKGKCTPDGAELKKDLPDALETECAKCSEKQQEMTKEWLKYLIEKKADLYSQLEAKYDAEGKYRKKYKQRAEAEGIKL